MNTVNTLYFQVIQIILIFVKEIKRKGEMKLQKQAYHQTWWS